MAQSASDIRRVAIVTGGSSGIGRAICLALARRGYAVAVVGQNMQRVQETAYEVDKAGGRGQALQLSVTDEDDMRRMADEVLALHGRIDVLVASAGIGKKPGSSRVIPYATRDLPLEEWSAVLDVNLTGVFLSNRAVLPAMRAQGQGHILNICSSTTPTGLRGTPYAPAYCASKFGVVGLTEALAEEMGQLGIRVQAVFPGAVQTNLVQDTVLAKPFRGAVDPDHFAEALVWMIEAPFDSVLVHPHIMYSRLPKVAAKKDSGQLVASPESQRIDERYG